LLNTLTFAPVTFQALLPLGFSLSYKGKFSISISRSASYRDAAMRISYF